MRQTIHASVIMDDMIDVAHVIKHTLKVTIYQDVRGSIEYLVDRYYLVRK